MKPKNQGSDYIHRLALLCALNDTQASSYMLFIGWVSIANLKMTKKDASVYKGAQYMQTVCTEVNLKVGTHKHGR